MRLYVKEGEGPDEIEKELTKQMLLQRVLGWRGSKMRVKSLTRRYMYIGTEKYVGTVLEHLGGGVLWGEKAEGRFIEGKDVYMYSVVFPGVLGFSRVNLDWSAHESVEKRHVLY